MDFKKLQIFFSKKVIKNFPLITQFFDVPFGVFRREIAGNGIVGFAFTLPFTSPNVFYA